MTLLSSTPAIEVPSGVGSTRGPLRRSARAAGVCYLVTFVSIPALLLLGPVLNHANYIVSSGSDTRVFLGCLLYVITALAGIGTAVSLFPVVKRQNEAVALGFVTSRVIEGALLIVGVLSLLSVVSLRRDLGGTGTDHASLITIGQALVGVRNWTFVLGDSLMPAVNALLLGYLLYRSRLVPRLLPTLGLIGGPLLIISTTTTLFRGDHRITALAAIATAPIFVWELSLGLWLVIKGFTPSPITAGRVSPLEVELRS